MTTIKPLDTTITPPVFDIAANDLPWSQDDVLPVDDDGNVLPGEDDIDDDPNDNGPMEDPGITNLPEIPQNSDGVPDEGGPDETY